MAKSRSFAISPDPTVKWRVYLHGIQLSVVKLGWMSEVVFRRLAEMINEPADEVSAGFLASFGLDSVWKNPSTKGGRQ